ncbi:SHOCT domain-containing protein [Flavobacterium tegetincola]|uniref:SHOCT domain-containing protein n=1 Tax=Flavobacterium tegetincola TaxID=150172 RepID=UPI0003F6B814|nr:SHOCT domain-containing protein [Flavobacterium tegetincola]
MGNSIGVGAIVGLAFASSIYVWKSESFSVLQKIILYICIIFPPAQWLGILIMLIYNNIKVENSAEKVSERKVEQVKTKLDSSINSLTELRDKGILTNVEYYEKVAKIKTEKAKEDIQNSSEYRQLKSLRDSGILTTEEFNLKVEQISKNELKSLLKKIN